MRVQSVVLTLVIIPCMLFIAAKPSTGVAVGNDCQLILDSANAFIESSSFAVNKRPNNSDPARNLKLDKWLRTLSFQELKCLLNSNDISVKMVGLLYATYGHRNNLMKAYPKLFEDTTIVEIMMADGSTSMKMKLGDLINKISGNIKKDDDLMSRKGEIELLVSGFIRKYSLYPTSYNPISYSRFTVHSDNEGVLGFNILHEYQLRDTKGKTHQLTNQFVFDGLLMIQLIAKDSSDKVASYPADLDYWLNEFGRKLTKDDSLHLRLR